MSDVDEQRNLAVAIARLNGLANDMSEVKGTLRELVTAVSRLAVIEERQAEQRNAVERAFKQIENHDERLVDLERAQPLQKQTSEWVQKVAGLVLAAVLGASLSGVIRTPDLKTPMAVVAPK